jgi:hypothetical protein
MCTHFGATFAFLSPCTPTFPPTNGNSPALPGRTYSTLWFSDFVEEKREKIKKEKHDIFACLK